MLASHSLQGGTNSVACSSSGSSSSSVTSSSCSTVLGRWHARGLRRRRRTSGLNSSGRGEISWEDQYALEKLEAQQIQDAKQAAAREREAAKLRMRRELSSSWNAKEAGGGRGGGADFLSELGQRANHNTNVDAGQNIDMIDSLFVGGYLGTKSDIADGSLRNEEFRTFNNICGDYYIAPKFLDAVSLFIAKNYLSELGCIDKKIKVPLILGIWGAKGMGKSFQMELCLKKLGAEAVVMSAGELEHEWAGTPGRLIRERYKKAGELSKTRGKLAVLLINDIDAGLGHFENTQTTVNNQMVIGTLMNLCDNPNSVATPGQDWQGSDHVRRSPIVVTGNDFTHMFAPLIRDGRMEKFYWNPSHDDLVNILHTLYIDDGLSMRDMEMLIKRFPSQPLDFFGALRASTYDNQIRAWIEEDVLGGQLLTHEAANMAALTERLAQKRDLPQFEPVDLTLEMLIAEGARLEMEQEHVNRSKLSVDYMKDSRKTKERGLKPRKGGRLVGFGG